MAKEVGYWQDNPDPEVYSEGPFVIVSAGGWRIEVEQKGHYCPVLPDMSIYKLLIYNRLFDGKTNDRRKQEQVCDWLNRQVKEGRIICNDKMWIAPSMESISFDWLRSPHFACSPRRMY